MDGPELDVQLFGVLAVFVAGEALVLRGRRRRALLALLVVRQGTLIPIDRLVADVWGLAPPSGAWATVQTYISQFRRQLGSDVVRSAGSAYGVTFPAGSVDIDRFTAMTSRGDQHDAAERLATLDRALALWHGAPLQEFAGAAWADEVIRSLELQWLGLQEERLDALLSCSRASEAVRSAALLVAEHPLHERFTALWMVALYRSGRQADALGAYRELRERLVDELGIDPSPELVELERRILVQDPELDPGRHRPDPHIAPPELPRGVVTFLLTDIVGSTQLWDQYADAMEAAMASHDALIEALAEHHHGHLLKARGEGDATMSVFARASDALDAAVAIHASLASDDALPSGACLEVRIGIHSGEVQFRDGDYFGGTVNRAARIRALAGPGQTLVSRATHDLAIDALAPGVELDALGEHELRGLQRAEDVYSLVAEPQPPASAGSSDGERPEAVLDRLGDDIEHLLLVIASRGSASIGDVAEALDQSHDEVMDGFQAAAASGVVSLDPTGEARCANEEVRRAILRGASAITLRRIEGDFRRC